MNEAYFQHVEDLLGHARTAARDAAEAKAQYNYLDHMRRHVLAKLMEESQAKSAAAKEMEALADDAYKRHLQGLAAAQIEAARSDWALKEAEYRIELFRTEQANMRAERRAYNA